MAEKQSKAELNAAKELIDAKKKALDAEKDLRSYKRSIQEKTSDISSLQKQIDAYSGDTSEEGRARLQKLKNELNSKKEDLEDAEYDRYLSDQKDMLDKLYEDYEESITQKIDDFSAAVDAALEKANDNMDTALGYLEQIAGEYQYGMEFGDLFTQGIKDTVDTFLANLENIKNPKPEPKSDPQESQPPNPNADKEEPDRRQTDSGSSVPVTDQGEPNAASLRDTAKRFIKNHAKNTQKKPEELSAVNKAIYKNKADSYKGTGKILPNKDLKTLATRLGVTYNGEGKKENLYQKLKKIKFPGFQKGGIISVEDIEKQVKRNGDDGIISAKNGEGIIPAELMPQFQEAFKHIPLINNIANSLIDIPKAPMFYPAEHIPCPTHIQATYNFTLENCANAEDMIHQIQHSQKVQKALRSVTLDQLSGSGRLSVKTIK